MADTSALSKADLCKALGWSKPKLDRRLDSDKNFPVRKRGTQAGGWEFDLSVVMKYLQFSTAAAPKPGRPIVKAAQEFSKADATSQASPKPAEHEGEATAKQRRDFAQARILEDKLARDRGELMDAETVRSAISLMLSRFAKGLDGLPDQIVKKLNLAEHRVDDIRPLVDDIRQAMVNDLKSMLAAEEPQAQQT